MAPEGGLEREEVEAAALATRAGRALLVLRERSAGEPRLGERGDLASHELLVGELAELFPGDPVRSEEGLTTVSGSGRLWIIDPLDGTREYGEPGRTDWAVHVALVVGGEPVVGAVALPALGLTLATGRSAPSVGAPRGGAPRLVVSRSRPPAVAGAVAAALGAETIPMGSAGAKIAAVVRGEADCYVHAGGQYEWDSAAPVAVALAAGLHASRLDGSPLRYGAVDAWLPDLVVCRVELAPAVLEACGEWDLEGGAGPVEV